VFVDQMERYFEQTEEAKKSDIHPEVYYQVGATPSFVEKARNHCDRAKQYANENQPMTICPPEADYKWRFFWRIGERPGPLDTKFPNLNAPQVIPEEFPQWEEIMNRWGNLMLETVKSVSEMAALGFGLDKDEFAKRLNKAPHLLAPTGSDLATYNKPGTMFASFHYDLNFLTIHGRSRFPGLFVWLRDGTRSIVRVPRNCLLLQAGKQFEWMTGGHVMAGFHEVVVVDETLAAVEKAKAENKSLWRVSSTLFSHIASDQVLEPLPMFKDDRSAELYPATLAGDQVKQELEAINLSK
jgi:isopenicillin N synthase-like dioxygenase